ncbi:HK97 family phage prohead protease [Dysgonomonas sp.]
MAENKRELPKVLEIDFTITDESVNRYGWRLLVAGIVLTGFLKNPVCCVQHFTSMIPVGKWKNLRVEGQELKGTVEFDRNDEEAVRLYWKYTDGYMNAVSLNVIPVEESEDSKLLLPGQKCATLVKSELLEISLVTIPGQANAVKLSTPEGKEYKLNLLTQNREMAKEEKTVEQLNQELEAQRKLNAENLVTIHKNRGVVADGEVESIKKLALADYQSTSEMLNARQVPKTEPTGDSAETLAEALVKLHFDRGAITEGEKAIFKGAATLDYEGTKKVLEAKTGKDGLQTFVQGLTNGGNQANAGAQGERAGWGYYEYFTKDPQALALMEKNEPDKFKKLAADFQASCTPGGALL